MDFGGPPFTHHIRANLWVVGEIATFLFASDVAGSANVVWADWRVLWVDTEHVQEFRRCIGKCARGRDSADSRHGRSGRVRGRPGQRRGPLLGDERIRSVGGRFELVHVVLCGAAECFHTVLVRVGAGSGTSCGCGGRSIIGRNSNWTICNPRCGCWSWNSTGNADVDCVTCGRDDGECGSGARSTNSGKKRFSGGKCSN